MNIILFGFKKCGKTYYGMKLASKLHREFLDSDHLVELAYEHLYHQSLSYREIVKKHGFPFFRNMEATVVSNLIQKKNCIIALGGGVVLDPENVERLQQIGKLVYLKTAKHQVKERILSDTIPSFLDPLHLDSSFEAFYQERLSIYNQITAYTIDTEHLSEEEVLEKLLELS